MELCSDQHDEIIHDDYNGCPICKLVDEKDNEIVALEEKVETLEEKIDELRDKLAGCYKLYPECAI